MKMFVPITRTFTNNCSIAIFMHQLYFRPLNEMQKKKLMNLNKKFHILVEKTNITREVLFSLLKHKPIYQIRFFKLSLC